MAYLKRKRRRPDWACTYPVKEPSPEEVAEKHEERLARRRLGPLCLHVAGNLVWDELNSTSPDSHHPLERVIPARAPEGQDNENGPAKEDVPSKMGAGNMGILWSNRWLVVVLVNRSSLRLFGVQHSRTVINKELPIEPSTAGEWPEKFPVPIASAFGDHNGLLGVLDNSGNVYIYDDESFKVTRHASSYENSGNNTAAVSDNLPQLSSDSSVWLRAIAINSTGRLVAIPSSTSGLILILEFDSIEHFLRCCVASSSTTFYPSLIPGRPFSGSYDLSARPTEYHTLDRWECKSSPRTAVATATSFAFLTYEGAVFTWGDPRYPNMLGREVTSSLPADRPGIVYESDLSDFDVKQIAASSWMLGVVTEAGAGAYVWGMGAGRSSQRNPWDSEECEAEEDKCGGNVLDAIKEQGTTKPRPKPSSLPGRRYKDNADSPSDSSDNNSPDLLPISPKDMRKRPAQIIDLALGDNCVTVVLKTLTIGPWHTELWGIGSNLRGEMGSHKDENGRERKFLSEWTRLDLCSEDISAAGKHHASLQMMGQESTSRGASAAKSSKNTQEDNTSSKGKSFFHPRCSALAAGCSVVSSCIGEEYLQPEEGENGSIWPISEKS